MRLKLLSVLLVLMQALHANAESPQRSVQSATFMPVTESVYLFDGGNMHHFESLGGSNWRVEDDAIVADEGRGPSYLVSKHRYKNYKLTVEFYASDDANSGIFLRCQDRAKISDRSCYEANIFDQRPDPSYGTGAIVLHAEVEPKYKAGGRWNTYEITVNGRDISLVLNGEETTRLRSGFHKEGHIALQHARGVMKFRKVLLEPISP